MTEQEMKSEGKSFGYAKDGTGWMFNDADSIYGEGLCNNCNTDKAVYLSSFADVEPNTGMLERQRIYKNNVKKGSSELFTNEELISKQYCRIVNTVHTKIIYYNAVIPLKHLDFFKNMPISKGCTFKITFQMNQVYFEVTKAATTGVLSFVKNSYVNRGGNKTNPLMVASVGMSAHTVDFEDITTASITALGNMYDTSLTFIPESEDFVDSITPCGSGGLPAATYKISNSIVTNNWSQQTQTEKTVHGLNNCRLYAETYVLHPDFSSIYLNTPTARVPFKNVITKNILNIEANGVIDTTITNGIANPIRLIIVPILSALANGVGTNLYSPLISPFTTEPATCSPYSLSDFNIEIAGKPVFNGKELKYTHEHFKYELGHSSTLSYDEWINNYGYIVVDLKRRIKDEYNTKTSVNLRGRNTGRKSIDLYCFLEYESDILLQLHTGKVEQA
jgi:hypothetical protein